MVLKSLKVKDVSYNLPVTGKMKPGLTFHIYILQVHKVATLPHKNAVCATPYLVFIMPEANKSDQAEVDKGVERIS